MAKESDLQTVDNWGYKMVTSLGLKMDSLMGRQLDSEMVMKLGTSMEQHSGEMKVHRLEMKKGSYWDLMTVTSSGRLMEVHSDLL